MTGRLPTGRYAIIGDLSAGKTLLMTAIAYHDHLKGIPIYSNYDLNFPHTRINKVEDLDKMHSGTLVMDEAWYTFDSRNFGTNKNKEGSYIFSKLAKRNMNAYLNMQSMDLIDGRYRDRMMAILIVETLKDKNDNPILMKVDTLKKDKWGVFSLSPSQILIEPSPVLGLYDTCEVIDSLI
ncbi:hypothetical protein SAMN04488589_0498 [Methanolobus vulcani]|uniref:Uncharacterized protein n=1 Tax=Methanolobus vulcani TaxID=38026 RepID=A0A7Z7AV53_9EURY|nr:hypothetical protein [Methanolobus vulcani]SDF43163.1 hypothetical protein SAMN04488589_0498 [Methanolobus vulcani]